MKVILSQDVPSLGRIGDLVKVADGYARNFLIPRRLALLATPKREKEMKHLQAVAEAKKKKAVAAGQKTAEKIKALTVTLQAQVGEGDRLFGSVTNKDIAAELNKMGYKFDRRDIVIEEPIKMLGQYRVKLKVVTGVEADLKVVVERQEKA